ncbi:MAG: [NiFe] hydrogenase metallocenter assembly protein HypF [Labilithrix sp.]|nr:[NiFe] hydrogenase metallocenter assembly protein HypF [Labilithrix sp.]
MHSAHNTPERARCAVRVRGTVQGVGFRPMVHRIAQRDGLAGFVRNDSEGVFIEVEGDDAQVLERFVAALRSEAPPLSRIDAIEVSTLAPKGEREFRVVASTPAPMTRAAVPADAATCDACLRELFDERNRRHRYPFLNCTDCGPRYTIIRSVPYDRAATTMDVFAMCAACRAEYEDPRDRRFHAEANACPACGPHVVLLEGDPHVQVAAKDAAIARAVELLARGRIVALKGLGGYQLAVDARNERAVSRLRRRKMRPDKALALMARDLDEVASVAQLTPESIAALVSPARPIVLLARAEQPASDREPLAPGVAPWMRELGVMLPSTPLHHLLFAEGPTLLVMTSGNIAGEPIVKDDDDAVTKLGNVADALLVHDRLVHTRCDDSVVRVMDGAARPLRRARGLAPAPVQLAFDAPPVLAVGAELKNAICFTRGSEAFLSQHIGDLASIDGRAFFEELIGELGRLLGVVPEVVAHDLHPDYASTRWALASGLRTVAVQHHHAHIASCLAEHRHAGPAIGIAFDGTGCGPAGDLWGGEVLLASLASFERLGHLRPIALAGGEAAIREPWRLAVAALLDAEEAIDLVGELRAHTIARLVSRGVAAPRATGAGRWFDAFAALLGVRDRVSYEAQAVMELEALACDADVAPYPFAIEERAGAPFVVDLRPTVRAVASGVRHGEPRDEAAMRVYVTMAEVVRDACRIVRRDRHVDVVALSGGCFQSARLTERAKALLDADGFEVLIHREVPANDGGIALGQAAIAAHTPRTKGDVDHVPRHTR